MAARLSEIVAKEVMIKYNANHKHDRGTSRGLVQDARCDGSKGLRWHAEQRVAIIVFGHSNVEHRPVYQEGKHCRQCHIKTAIFFVSSTLNVAIATASTTMSTTVATTALQFHYICLHRTTLTTSDVVCHGSQHIDSMRKVEVGSIAAAGKLQSNNNDEGRSKSSRGCRTSSNKLNRVKLPSRPTPSHCYHRTPNLILT